MVGVTARHLPAIKHRRFRAGAAEMCEDCGFFGGFPKRIVASKIAGPLQLVCLTLRGANAIRSTVSLLL